MYKNGGYYYYTMKITQNSWELSKKTYIYDFKTLKHYQTEE